MRTAWEDRPTPYVPGPQDREATSKTLLLGMGNPILRDDAVGVRLAADVARRLGPIEGLDVVTDCAVGGLEVLPVIEGYRRLLVFDSIKTRGGTPGAWYRFTAADLGSTMNLTNVHDTNLATALELGRRAGLTLPGSEAIVLFAVEILDNLTFDEHMTPALEEAYPELVDAICAETQAVLGVTTEPLTRGPGPPVTRRRARRSVAGMRGDVSAREDGP